MNKDYYKKLYQDVLKLIQFKDEYQSVDDEIRTYGVRRDLSSKKTELECSIKELTQKLPRVFSLEQLVNFIRENMLKKK